MSETEDLQRKLNSTGKREWEGSGLVLPSVTPSFPRRTELTVLKKTRSQPWCQSIVTDACHLTIYMTGSCVFHNLGDTWGHTPQGLLIFSGRGNCMQRPRADFLVAGHHSRFLRPASFYCVLNSLMFKPLYLWK